MTIPDETNVTCILSNTRAIPFQIWRIMAYPFAYYERELSDFFKLYNSKYVLKEVYLNINSRLELYCCSIFCAYISINDRNSQISFIGYYRQFESILGLQLYCQFHRCVKCLKYLTNINLNTKFPSPTQSFTSFQF